MEKNERSHNHDNDPEGLQIPEVPEETINIEGEEGSIKSIPKAQTLKNKKSEVPDLSKTKNLLRFFRTETKRQKLPRKIHQKYIEYIDEIERKPINTLNLKKMIFQGCPDSLRGYRPLVWKILLEYLPSEDHSQWDDILAKKRALYKSYVGATLNKSVIEMQDLGEEEIEEINVKLRELYLLHEDGQKLDSAKIKELTGLELSDRIWRSYVKVSRQK